jgi:chromosome segregation ATPase
MAFRSSADSFPHRHRVFAEAPDDCSDDSLTPPVKTLMSDVDLFLSDARRAREVTHSLATISRTYASLCELLPVLESYVADLSAAFAGHANAIAQCELTARRITSDLETQLEAVRNADTARASCDSEILTIESEISLSQGFIQDFDERNAQEKVQADALGVELAAARSESAAARARLLNISGKSMDRISLLKMFRDDLERATAHSDELRAFLGVITDKLRCECQSGRDAARMSAMLERVAFARRAILLRTRRPSCNSTTPEVERVQAALDECAAELEAVQARALVIHRVWTEAGIARVQSAGRSESLHRELQGAREGLRALELERAKLAEDEDRRQAAATRLEKQIAAANAEAIAAHERLEDTQARLVHVISAADTDSASDRGIAELAAIIEGLHAEIRLQRARSTAFARKASHRFAL